MLNEKLATVSAQDIQDAQNEHYRVDSDIRRLVDGLTLAEKMKAHDLLTEGIRKMRE